MCLGPQRGQPRRASSLRSTTRQRKLATSRLGLLHDQAAAPSLRSLDDDQTLRSPSRTKDRNTEEAASHKADGQPIDQEVIEAPAPWEEPTPCEPTPCEPVVVTPVASEPNDPQVIKAPAPLEPVAAATSTESLTTTTSATATNSSRRPIDYAALREQIPLLQVLQQLSRVPIQGEQHRGPCPLHEPTANSGRHFSANLKRQLFRCFHPNCQAQGNVLDLWQTYRKLDLYDAAIDLAKTLGIEVPYLAAEPPKQRKSSNKKPSGHHPPSP